MVIGDISFGKVPKSSDSIFEVNGYKVFVKRLKKMGYVYLVDNGVLLTPFDPNRDNEWILNYVASKTHLIKEYTDGKCRAS